MTRKTLFISQGQSVPQRRTYDGAIGEPQYRDVGAGQSADRRAGYTPNNPQIIVDSHNGTESARSPTEHLTSPSAGYLSHTDALSPDSTFTPSVSSVNDLSQQPSRKRARTASHSDLTPQNGEAGRPKSSDLAGLLNPQDESPTYSPKLTIVDFDNSQPLPQLQERLSTVQESTSLSYRLASATQFVEIKPRPPGQFTDADQLDLSPYHDGDNARRKGRKGPLESDQRRAEVLEVRGMGACLRCHIMRIRCEAVKDGPCANCRETLPKSRKWTIPCSREWLRSRYGYFFPPMTRNFHNAERSIPEFPPEILGEPFKLELTHLTGFKFRISVCEAKIPAELNGYYKRYFTNLHIRQEGNTIHARTFLTFDSCLPLVPADVLPGPASYQQAVKITSDLLQKQVKDISHDWVRTVFPESKGQDWAREVLVMILHFQREVTRCTALDEALKTLMVRCLLNYPFHIPCNRMSEVNNMLSADYRVPYAELQEKIRTEDFWSPKIVNKWIKSALYKLLEFRLQVLLQELELLFKLQENGGDQAKLSSLDRDEAFAVIALTLIIIANMQVGLMASAPVWQKERDDLGEYQNEPNLVDEAKYHVQKMEDEVVNHILQLWKYRFYKQDMKGTVSAERQSIAQAAQNFNLLSCFDKLAQRYSSSLLGIEAKMDLSEDKIQLFKTHNETRLLMRMYQAIWRPKSQK